LVQIDVRGAPGRSKGVPGSISGLKPRKNGPKILIFTPFLPPFLGRAHIDKNQHCTFGATTLYKMATIWP